MCINVNNTIIILEIYEYFSNNECKYIIYIFKFSGGNTGAKQKKQNK